MGEDEIMSSKFKIITLVAALLLLVLGYLAYQNLIFRLVSSSPQKNGEHSIASDLKFTFSKTLDASMKNKFKLSPYTAGIVVINGKELIFKPSSMLKLNQAYSATIESPLSQSGESIDDITINFTAKYIPFSKTSKQQQQEEINESNSLEAKHPILSKLPHETQNYKIDYELQTNGKIKLKIELYAVLNNPSQEQAYLSALKQYKQEALDFLNTQNVDLADYEIIYTPNPDTGR